MTTKAAPECIEKAELRAALMEAVGNAIALNARLLEAALSGDYETLTEFDKDLRKMRACKDNMLHAYCKHVKQHRC